MKKYLLIFMAVLLLALPGCNRQNPEDGTEQNEEEVDNTTILDQREMLSEDGIISYIYNEYIEDGIQQEIYNFQENMLISSFYYDDVEDASRLDLELVSTQTGELIAKASLFQLESPLIQILDRNIAVKDGFSGHVYILNSSLETETDYEAKGIYLLVNKMMTKIFAVDDEDGIQVIDLMEGTSERWIKEAENLYVSKVCGDYVTFVYTDSKTNLSAYAFLNLATDEMEILELNESLYSVEHNSRVWLAGLVGESGVYFLGTEENPQVFEVESDGLPTMMAASDDIVVSKADSDGNLKLTAYRCDGTFLSSTILPESAFGYWGNIVWFESLHGYLFTSIDTTGTDKLYYWDTSVETAGENLQFSSLESQVQTGDSVSAELYERAAAIGEKYGVTIKIAEQCDTDYGNYTVEQNMNEKKISRGLDVLEQSLASYPEGFLKQLYFGYYRKLEINLMGNIYATEQVEENKNGFDSFIAFVQQKEGKYVMTIDLARGQLIEQDLYHEISHMIDKKLQYMADQGKSMIYSEEKWASFNPKDFEYVYSYSDVPASYYYDGYDDYFVDVYSRTFPTEDRARIMEYAMIGAEFCFDTYPGLGKKLAYYCECIRDGFDTTGWPEVTKWEEILMSE